MEATIQMVKDIQSGNTYEHRELVAPFDNISIVSKAYQEQGYGKSDFIIKTYEDNSLIETQRLLNIKDMLSAMRRVGGEWG